MGKNKAVLIEKKGKQLKYSLNDRPDNVNSNDEFAAALDDSDDSDDSIPVLTGVKQYKKGFYKKQLHKSYQLRPILFSIGAAIVIGSLLGFAMLRIFVGVESEITGHAVNSSPVTSAVTDYNENAAVNSLFDFEPLQAHILQAGIFSEKANAEEWSADYAAKGIETFTWERDQQFFLIAGAATTIEQAKFTADELKIDGSIDIFVKEWSTLGGEAGLTSDETEWLIQFQDLWHDSLKELSESNTFSLEKWHELIDAKPDKTESLLPMIASIGETTGVGDSIKLLQWMYLYEQIME